MTVNCTVSSQAVAPSPGNPGDLSKRWLTKPDFFLQSTFEGKVNRDKADKALDNHQITNANHPINTGTGLTGDRPLTNAGLSNWGFSVHSTFSGAPAGYSTIQTAAGRPVTLVK